MDRLERTVLVVGAAVVLYSMLGRSSGAGAGSQLPILIIPGLPGNPPASTVDPCANIFSCRPACGCVPGAPDPANPGIPYTPPVQTYCTANVEDPICVGANQGGGGADVFSTLPGGVSGPVVLQQ